MKNSAIIPLTQKAYKIIKEKIIHLQLRPGELLMVQQLAKNLDISRTPVREALVTLTHEGLVAEAEGRKFKVTEVTITSINEIFSIREALECHAIREVIDSYTKEDLDEARAIIEKMKVALQNKEFDLFFSLDNEFHYTYLNKYNNSLLNKMMVQIDDKIQRIRYFTYYINQRLAMTIMEHEEILRGIEQANVDIAQNGLKIHLDNVKNGMQELLINSSFKQYGANVLK